MRATIGLTVVLLAACAAPASRAPENGEHGSYSLVSMDGHRLPHLEVTGSAVARRELVDGILHLRDDGTFSMVLTFDDVGGGPRRSPVPHDGVWTRAGDVIDLEFTDLDVVRAIVRHGAVLFELDGIAYRWEPDASARRSAD